MHVHKAYTLHLPPQTSDGLTVFFRITGIDNPDVVKKQLEAIPNPLLFCGYHVSETGELFVTAYAREIANWPNPNDTYWVAFTFRTMLFDIVPSGVFRFPAQAGEEPTLVWREDVRNHEAPKLLTADGTGYALGMR